MVQRHTSPPQSSDDASADAQNALPRVIKKYPNRRLYDTQTSTYITMSEVKQMVLSHEHFTVCDAKTQEDLTRSILLQIILDEETAGVPLFTTDALANIIRFYGQAMHGFMGPYLERHMQNMIEMQSKLADQSKTITPEMWARFLNTQTTVMQNLMAAYFEQGHKTLAQLQEQMQKSTEQMFGAFVIKR